MKMNKNVVHNGRSLFAGEECPKDLEKEMHAQGHLDLDISSLTVSTEPPAEHKEPKAEKQSHKKGK